MHLFNCVNAPCGFDPFEYSARDQLLELNVGVNGTPSVALINNGTSHCFAKESLVKTIFREHSLNWPFQMDPYICLHVFF